MLTKTLLCVNKNKQSLQKTLQKWDKKPTNTKI
jgi:hypothetical protein